MRAVTLANVVKVPLFVVHVMSKGAMGIIARARAAGQRVIGEALSSGIGVNQSLIWDSDYLVQPYLGYCPSPAYFLHHAG